MEKVELVKIAMLSVQRYCWEQGVCMQALYEWGDKHIAYAMAHDAVIRQSKDGRLAITGPLFSVTDPAVNGEVVYRAYLDTGKELFKTGAQRMLDYLMNNAPRTKNGIICHNEISFVEEFSPNQVWVDSIYMMPPFLAVMGEIVESEKQIMGLIEYLKDDKTGLLYHIYDAEQNRFVRQALWATGNGWAILGIARVIEQAILQNKGDIKNRLIQTATDLLDSMIKFQLPDGRFYDEMDKSDTSYPEGTGAMMMAAAIYRGVHDGWLTPDYLKYADLVADTMEQYVDDLGVIHEVCGCVDFEKPGTSAESMAAYIMMHTWKKRNSKNDSYT